MIAEIYAAGGYGSRTCQSDEREEEATTKGEGCVGVCRMRHVPEEEKQREGDGEEGDELRVR
jgi:hypothetical protein